ncbi:ceramidase domain-containing protein [Nocardioides sp. Root151]|uniref:ceramidase domain-containing protein n=1 Tax=Nocardioides sp. Root151 TaxID=1736475 RepID=UPI000703227B|nr:ceramidase domain-containing protein [Nocardioides sp. Root151]KQZ75351.1 hypothetical protein ASD66_03025 [Nocardioides sp. Root151]
MRPGPVVCAGVVAVAGVGLLLLAAYDGWLGADVGRGDTFCEAARGGFIKQPANTWSNLGFVAAGLAIAWSLLRHSPTRGALGRHRSLAPAFAVLVVLLGPASMAMHATQSSLGGHLDMASMYLVASFIAGYALMRLLGRGPGFLAIIFVVFVAACEIAGLWSREIPVVMYAGNVAFGFLLVVGLAIEAVLVRRGLFPHARWAWAAVACMVVAFTIWNLTASGTGLCSPDSLLQGHAVWHVLCAASAYCLYRHYATEIDRDPTPARLGGRV